MMGIETIRQMNAERAAEAAERGLKPYVFDGVAEVDALTSFPFPHIGDHRPEDWTYVHKHFVDATGLGHDDEPALSASQFKRLIRKSVEKNGSNVGFAIIEAGQFQVYVGEFRRDA